ncbi:hypothetical protein BO78DRAFT_352848 [Aspergillus sclerotiicarbonarius CBS 121057]|uniref:Uncharacterized protein n=1 Tax=Aspergillus sclerotiicarbonarius (strain CBS 121057 / IBT 28362) TaxID=1448318 RepID=A0A319E5M3_ASPSB|nr:hypothetical protein BO78DRAFT_352848 [Aspergillus sclerotiicarbonarius CBS 121057]
MSKVNMVRYFFYKRCLPEDAQWLQALVALAYQTARDRKLYPKAILIRSVVHATTSINGRRQKDPLGPHVTFCYKDEAQLAKGTHVACHGYVAGGNSLEFVRSTHAGEKADSSKKSSGGVVWPSEEQLEEAPEIGYGHFPEDEEK